VNVLLLDELNTPPASLPELRKEMVQYLAEVQPGTSMAIFVLTSRLRMVTGFTTDVSQFARLFDDKKTMAQSANSTGPAANDEGAAKTNRALITQKETEESDREAIQGGPAGPGLEASIAAEPGGLIAVGQLNNSLTEQADRRIDDRVGTTLAAFRLLARYLSAIPGRKNLIWLSGSFPMFLGPGETEYEPAVRATMSLLAAARVAVYPVDATGLTIGSSPTYPGQTMRFAAELTGGQAYVNTNGFKEAMADAVQSGSSYYTVGYLPGDKPFNGKFRKINVRLDKGHYTLNYRTGYYADPPDNPSEHSLGQANLITEAARYGVPPMTQILFVAQILPATDPAFKNLNFKGVSGGEMAATMKQPAQLYAVNLTVDAHDVVFNQTSNGVRQAKIKFALIAYDAGGNCLNFLVRNYEINIKPENMEQEMKTGIHARVGFDLPAGHESLRIAVEDLNAGRAGSVEIPLSVAEK
jgi:VWFA-related protein